MRLFLSLSKLNIFYYCECFLGDKGPSALKKEESRFVQFDNVRRKVGIMRFGTPLWIWKLHCWNPSISILKAKILLWMWSFIKMYYQNLWELVWMCFVMKYFDNSMDVMWVVGFELWITSTWLDLQLLSLIFINIIWILKFKFHLIINHSFNIENLTFRTLKWTIFMQQMMLNNVFFI